LTTTETKTDCTREIQVEVPADVVARETESIIQRLQKLARLPGFRRGHVPASIVRQRFGEDVKSEVIESLVPKYFRREVEKQGLDPVSQPRVSDLDLKEGEPLRFKASFEILPEIDISGYEEVRAECRDTSVSDEEVDRALNSVREQHATFNAIDGRELQDGDYAQVSLTGTPAEVTGSEPGKAVTMDDVLVEIGGAKTVPEFTENLRGARPGDEKTFGVTYPENFSDQRLAGKMFTYHVKVKGIKQKVLPELNDDFAKELGELQSFDELKTRIREQLEHEKQHTVEHEGKEKLLDDLVRRNEFPVPESLVDRQIDVRLERGLRALAAQGMKAEDMKRMDLSRLRVGQRDAALREVKASLILDRIALRENIEVSDDEINKEIEALAAQTKQEPEAVRARLTRDGALDRIRNRIRSEKTLDILYRRSA
jgi:trigger factor